MSPGDNLQHGPAFHDVCQALDQLEGLVHRCAYPGAGLALTRLRESLAAQLDASAPATRELMWSLFSRVEDALRARRLELLMAAASDLREELVSLC